MNAANSIRLFARRTTHALVFLGFLKGLLRALPCLGVSLFLLSILDLKVEIPIWGLRVLWTAGTLGTLVLLMSGFTPFSIFSIRDRARNLQRRAPTLRRDELRIAVELANQQGGDAQELRGVFLEQAARKIEACHPFWCFPSWKWRTPSIALLLTFALGGALLAFYSAHFSLSPNALFPFSSRNIERFIKIEPGDAQVPAGQDAVVKLILLDKSAKDPQLQVRTADQWTALEPDSVGLGRYSFTVKKVTVPLYYRVVWKKETSRRFILIPVEPVRFIKFSVKIHSPDYLEKEPVVQESPEIAGLAGSRVEMDAEASAPLEQASVLFLDGRQVSAGVLEDSKARFVFSIEKSGTYTFSLAPKTGKLVQQEAVYPIRVTEDQPPTVTLLSPDQDVVVGQKEKLPITFDARDDYGLSESFFVFESKRKGAGRVRIKRFDGAVDSVITTHEWDLSVPSFQPGEVVRFQVEVWDGNSLTGPGKAVSEWRLLEIKSFEQDHALLEKALEAWRNKALESLAAVSTLKSKIEPEDTEMSTLTGAFNQPAQDLQALEDSLKKIVNAMEEDPMADYGVWLEHREMEENLSALNLGAAREAQAAFQTQNKKAASARLDEIANQIERMSNLSENLSKAQKARDVMDAGDKLEDIGEELMQTLETAPPSEALSKIKDLINEAQKSLMEMTAALEQMPQDLPDDFINQEALKNLEIGKSQDILGEITQAIKRGDMKTAMALAQKFSEMAKNMRKQLSKAHESFLQSNSAAKLGEEITEQQEALERLADRQRQVLAGTQKLASKRFETVMKSQQDLLAQLAARQEKVIEASATVPPLAGQVKPMREVAAEFRAKRLEHSQGWLESIVSQIGVVKAELARSSASVNMIEKAGQIQAEESAILSIIKNPPVPAKDQSSENRERHDGLQKQELGIRGDLQGIKQKLQILSQRTATLGAPLMRSLGEAATEMEGAAQALDSLDSPMAQRFEENALDKLLESQSQLGQAQSSMSDMAEEQGGQMGEGGGSGKSGAKVILRNAPGGSRGTRTGKVKLPTADDYRPPKAFREDLLESLKENYPQIYEEIIHKYYKRLAE